MTETETKSDFDFKITDLDLIGIWTYNAENKTCFCTRDLQAPTQSELLAGKIINGITFGDCDHAFHDECLEQFIREKGNICPIDQTIWKTKHMINSVTKIVVHDDADKKPATKNAKNFGINAFSDDYHPEKK